MGAHMKPEIIEKYGTKVFDAPKDSVYKAVKAIMIEQDFGIGIEKPEKGEIKTKRKILSAYGDAHSAAFYYKQYVIKIEEKEPGKTTVVMTPRLFHQETDISDKACWVIKGKAGEIKLWESLFKEIQEQL